MANEATTPASFEEAKALARKNMLAARANSANDDATPAQTASTETDDEPTPVTQTSTPSAEDEPEESPDTPAAEADETDDEDDDESEDVDETDDDEESDEDADDDEEEAPRPKPEAKRKPSRRSKRIQTLQQKIADLEANSANAEERLLQRLEQEQARRVALENEKRQREADERALEAEMQEYLGSDDEYQAAVDAALRGDVFEAEKARAWHERRQIVGKLSRRAEARVNQRAAEIFWSSTEGLPGVAKQVLEKSDFGSVLKHLHAAGYSAAASEAKREVEKRDAKIARLEAQLATKKVKTAARAATADPVEGGTPVPPRKEKSIYEQALDPVTQRIDRDKFNELRRKAGLSVIA